MPKFLFCMETAPTPIYTLSLHDALPISFINLKSDPEVAIELRETYEGVQPGYHMNKSLWNSVYLQKDVPDHVVYELIDRSYDLIVSSLSKKLRDELST